MMLGPIISGILLLSSADPTPKAIHFHGHISWMAPAVDY